MSEPTKDRNKISGGPRKGKGKLAKRKAAKEAKRKIVVEEEEEDTPVELDLTDLSEEEIQDPIIEPSPEGVGEGTEVPRSSPSPSSRSGASSSEMAFMRSLMTQAIESQRENNARVERLMMLVLQGQTDGRKGSDSPSTVSTTSTASSGLRSAMKKPSPFSGKKGDKVTLNPVAWISLMKPYLAASGVTGDQAKIAATVSYLTADAATWWTSLKTKPTAWKEFKTLFFSRYVFFFLSNPEFLSITLITLLPITLAGIGW